MNKTFLYILVMALVTYGVRMIPFLLFSKRITSVFLKSVLHYIPYAVLSAMIIPDVFFSAGAENVIPAVLGTIAAIIFSFLEKSLLTVAVVACLITYLGIFIF